MLKAPLTQNPPHARPPKTWVQHLADMKQRVAALEFDVALLGCGAYAMPLGAHIKSLGKKAIVVGGALQMHFGIMGSRWEKDTTWQKQYPHLPNEHWTRPRASEKPRVWTQIENGCYW